ncbi:MAG: family 43 glycosylhydrolase [Ignavibacteriales bacterium]|nr:family 43 glycosylhydrolase [Ignavibacteriales bacterium]
MKKIISFAIIILLQISILAQDKKSIEIKNNFSGNPIIKGWYADPEAEIFNNKFWIFPTYSGEEDKENSILNFSHEQIELRKNTINPQYLKQTFLDAFSSEDLLTWEEHPRVLDISNVKWAAYAVWAPSIFFYNNKYYLFFGANDIQNDDQIGGIGVAVSDKPEGPYNDLLGKPLINKFHNGAQPIDQFVFKDEDNTIYMYYGGWKHCNVVKLNNELNEIIPFENGETFKEITPENYVEGSFLFKKNGKYYFMWSEGGWTGPDYSVAYAIGDSPVGPFKRIGKILQQDLNIARGAGHHSCFKLPDTDEWYIVYHRRPLGVENGNHREVCIDRMYFDENGKIIPIKMTFDGVEKRSLTKQK